MKLIKFTILVAYSINAFVFADDSIITTTLNSQQERSAAIVDQESFIQAVLLDAATNYDEYTSIMLSKSIQFPPALMQFLVELDTYQLSEFPTSVYTSDFPFTDFQTFITNFPWIEGYMSQYSMSTFKVPSDYSVLTLTENNAVSVAVSATPVSSSAMSILSPTASISSSSSSLFSSIVSATSSPLASTAILDSSSTSSDPISSSSSSVGSGVSIISSSSSHNAANTIVPNIAFVFLLFLSI